MTHFGQKWSFLTKIGHFCLRKCIFGRFSDKNHEKWVIWSVHTLSGTIASFYISKSSKNPHFWVKIVIFHFLKIYNVPPEPLMGTPLPGLSGKGQKSRMSEFLIKTIKLVINQHNLMIYRVPRAQNGSKSREKVPGATKLPPDRGVKSKISSFIFNIL